MFWIIIIAVVVAVWASDTEESEESKEAKRLEEESSKMKDRMNMLEAKLIDLQKAERKNDGNEI